MTGTTHFTNAVVQRRELVQTGVVRLCLPAGEAVPPLYDWPADIRQVIGNQQYLAHGGHDLDGRETSPLNTNEFAHIADKLTARGINAIAIVCVFAPVMPDHENQAATFFQEHMDGVDITVSHEIGRLGLLERENATALNASLAPLARRTVRGFRNALEDQGISANLYVTQNDGTLLNADFAEPYPVLTFSSGPANSMRGAAILTGLNDGVVIDIGGTTRDVGVLTAGFPRGASLAVEIGGVRTNFRMPDLVSLGLGGGSLACENGRVIGPVSVGYQLRERAVASGGQELTAIDVAVASGWATLCDPQRLATFFPKRSTNCEQARIQFL